MKILISDFEQNRTEQKRKFIVISTSNEYVTFIRQLRLLKVQYDKWGRRLAYIPPYLLSQIFFGVMVQGARSGNIF